MEQATQPLKKQDDPDVSAARPPQPRPAPVKRPAGPVAVRIIQGPPAPAVTPGADPWFFVFPRIALESVRIAFLPFRWFVTACEIVVSVSFAALVGIVLLWWFKIIPDADVYAFVATFGERIQGILKGSGLM